MKRIHWLLKLFLILFSLSVFGGEFELIKPYGQDIYYSKYAAVVVRKGSGVDRISVFVGDKLSGNVEVKSDHEEYFCLNVKLNLGVNKIKVIAYSKDRKVYEAIRQVYYKSILYKKYRYPPKIFHKQFFHTEENEKICSECHDMSVNEQKGIAFEDIIDSNCFDCHKPIYFEKYMHAPAANWLCATSCHTGKTGTFNEKYKGVSRFLYPDPIAPVCFGCHKKFKKKFYKENYRHEPVDDGRCNKCHDPHGGNGKKFLRYKVWKLCTTCHVDKKTKGHVVTTFSRKSHPTKGKKDPTDPKRELSCISCHNPHVSNNGFMLRGYMGRGTMLWCRRCHKK